jgi:hypothetical protein
MRFGMTLDADRMEAAMITRRSMPLLANDAVLRRDGSEATALDSASAQHERRHDNAARAG